MAITRINIVDCPSRFDFQMAIFGPEADEDDRITSKKPRLFRVTVPGGAHWEIEVLSVGKGYYNSSIRDRCFHIEGRFWEKGAPTENKLVARCWSRSRDGFLLVGEDDELLEVREGQVYSDGKSIGFVDEIEPFQAFLRFEV